MKTLKFIGALAAHFRVAHHEDGVQTEEFMAHIVPNQEVTVSDPISAKLTARGDFIEVKPEPVKEPVTKESLVAPAPVLVKEPTKEIAKEDLAPTNVTGK